MIVSRENLKTLLNSNVCEISFLRRMQKLGAPPFRRMLCTNNQALLTSNNGIKTLNYKRPTHLPRYNPDQKNLVIAWDIFMQDYRNISCDRVDVIQSLPADDTFWKYYTENLMKLTTQQKLMYMEA